MSYSTMSYVQIPPPIQCYCLTTRACGRSVRYFASPCFSWWCTIFLGTGRGSTKPTSGSLCGLGLFTRSPSCELQISVIRKTQLRNSQQVYMRILRSGQTLRYLRLWDQGLHLPFLVRFSVSSCCYRASSPCGFQLRVCASGYGSVWS
jgi:hypothetical protein